MFNEKNNTKEEIIDGIKYTYSSEWIKDLESKEHWSLYWQQQKTIQNYLKEDKKILEIGIGTGFTKNYLESKGFDILTLDIDEDKKPDIVANIVTYSWEKTNFDFILAFEVFEHIRFEDFTNILKKLKKTNLGYLFISLPLNRKTIFELSIKFPKLKKREFKITIPKNKITTKNHFWEIDYGIYSEAFIENEMLKCGFSLEKKYKQDNYIFLTIKNND